MSSKILAVILFMSLVFSLLFIAALKTNHLIDLNNATEQCNLDVKQSYDYSCNRAVIESCFYIDCIDISIDELLRRICE